MACNRAGSSRDGGMAGERRRPRWCAPGITLCASLPYTGREILTVRQRRPYSGEGHCSCTGGLRKQGQGVDIAQGGSETHLGSKDTEKTRSSLEERSRRKDEKRHGGVNGLAAAKDGSHAGRNPPP